MGDLEQRVYRQPIQDSQHLKDVLVTYWKKTAVWISLMEKVDIFGNMISLAQSLQ